MPVTDGRVGEIRQKSSYHGLFAVNRFESESTIEPRRVNHPLLKRVLLPQIVPLVDLVTHSLITRHRPSLPLGHILLSLLPLIEGTPHATQVSSHITRAHVVHLHHTKQNHANPIKHTHLNFLDPTSTSHHGLYHNTRSSPDGSLWFQERYCRCPGIIRRGRFQELELGRATMG
jgi:hypothetical protein